MDKRVIAVLALFVATTSACGAHVQGSGTPVHHPPRTVHTRAAAPAVQPVPTRPVSSAAAPRTTAPSPTPAAVVTRYFAAINAGDYDLAWRLGGRSFSSSLGSFIEGFDTTARDVVSIRGVTGSTVSVGLVAYQTDGSVKHFAGTYSVGGGMLLDADISQTDSTPAPVPTGGSCGAPDNPWGYNFCGPDSPIYSAPDDFCDYFDCIANFPYGTGYVVQCEDGMFSQSGGRLGACSFHGGESQELDN